MKLAISGEALGSTLSLAEIITVLKENHVTAIELWPENVPLLPGRELIHKRLYANRDIERAGQILAAAGIEVACVCFGAAFDEALAGNRELYAAELKRAVQAARILGAKVVNHYCYHVAMGPDYSLAVLHQYYDQAIAEAERSGIYLALENEAHDITADPDQMKRIVEGMNSPHFRTNYDAANYYQAGFEGFPYGYERLKELLVHVHIKNACIYVPEHGHDRLCRGEAMSGSSRGHDIYYPVASDGAVNVDGLVRRLIHDGYQGYCTLEPHTVPDKCLAYYRAETEYLYERGFRKPDNR